MPRAAPTLRLISLLCAAPLLSACRPPAPIVTTPEPESVVEVIAPKQTEDLQAVVPITFEDLDLPMEPDSLFEEYLLTQRVRDLTGRTVRLQGFMFAGSVFTTSNVKRFIMLREKECPFGAGGQAHHAIDVELLDTSTRFRVDPITVEGVLTIRPFTGENGNTWSVYHLAATKVE